MTLREIPPIHLSTQIPSQPDVLLLDNSSPSIRYELYPFDYDVAHLYDPDDEDDIDPYCELYNNLIPPSSEETKSTMFYPCKKIVASDISFDLEASFDWKDNLVVHVGSTGVVVPCSPGSCCVYYVVMRGDNFVSGFRDEKTTYQLGDGESTSGVHNGVLYICNSGDVSSVVVIREEEG